MSSEMAIKVENLSKCYQIYEEPQHRLLQMIYRGRKQFGREFWAVKNVSFEVKRGETVGIIGRNGSGKSTLLQMICGTLNPTSGSVIAHGRIAALLELGSGFNPEFTGKENIYMNASILGLSHDEIDSCFDDIVAFADIGDFLDQPVKTYSSGMFVRLAFAVAAHTNPSTLIVDEALAVGDAKFQAKCFERLKKLKDSGTSILLVTHSSEQIVTHCSKALLLENGQVLQAGNPKDVVNRYMDLLFGKKTSEKVEIESTSKADFIHDKDEINYNLSISDELFSSRHGYNVHEYRWGDGAAKILDYYLEASGDPYPSIITTGQLIKLVTSIRFLDNLARPIIGITIKTKEGVTVYGSNSELLEAAEGIPMGQCGTVIQSEFSFQCSLAPGDYFISLGVATYRNEEILPHDRRYDAIHLQIKPCKTFFGLVDLGLTLTAKEIF